MARFEFEGRDVTGQKVKGELDAGSEIEVRTKLRAQKINPIRVGLVVSKSTSRSSTISAAKPKDLQVYTRQLSTLLSSGIPILQSLEVLSQGVQTAPLVRASKQIANSLSQGKKLADALAEHPKVFDKFYVNMIEAAEKSGQLDVVLSRLANYIEKAVKLNGKIKGAMTYPLIIVIVAFLVIAGLMIYVIPKFQGLFAGSGKPLPAITQFVINVSHFFVNFWYLIILGIFGLIIGIRAYYQTSEGREILDGVLMRIPILGDLIKKGAIAKFSRTLSTLLSSGVGIIEGLDIAAKVAGNVQIEKALLRARDSISEGKTIVAPLSKEKFIPTMVLQMLTVGEETGNLDQMLGKIADFYEDEVDVVVDALTSIIEPLLMVVLGVIIAFIVVAMYLPIFGLADAVGGG